jgi:hypothetical protein
VSYARLGFISLLISAQLTYAFARLTSQTVTAFDRYVELTEARMNHDLQPERFLRVDGKPDVKAKLRGGEVRIESSTTLDNGKQIKIPDGMIQDWVGTMFMPNATIAQVKAVLQDYENYKSYYAPEVTESKQIAHQGDEYDVFLRLYKKHMLTVVLNTNYHVRYAMLDPRRMYVISHATRIAEVKNARNREAGEEPVGNDTGFLWRLNSYWRFEEADGGVYAECEAVSLSRDVPLGLGFLLRGFLEQFPKESMVNTLRGTKAAVAKQSAKN